MLTGTVRFGRLRDQVPGITDRMLSIRLKELIQAGLAERRVIDSTPVRIEYHLTDAGRALAPVLHAIEQWAHAWILGHNPH